MPSGLSARVVAVCTLILGVSIAHAERRPVAVIELSGDSLSARVAADLNPVLLTHPELQPIADPLLTGALYQTTNVDPDEDHFRKAGEHKSNAEIELNKFSLERAQEAAGLGELELHDMAPSGKVLTLYSQLAFLRGQAMLGLRNQAANASQELALANRFDPGFVPDPARYLPDVVQAFQAAKAKWTGKGTLVISGHGRMWLDGRETTMTPEIEVDAGPHVVWLTGADRLTTAKMFLVEAGKKTKVEIADMPIDTIQKVRRARVALRKAPDPAARGVAMQHLAALVGVEDAILLSAANDKVIYQTWNAGKRKDLQPGFSSLREMKPSDKPSDLLKPLSPPKPTVEPPKDERPKVVVDERRWYQRRPVQATIAIGIVAAIIGGYYIYKAATDDTVVFDNNPGFGTMGRVRW